MNLLTELKRRNVFRVGAAYAIVAWLLVQAADILLGNFGAPEWVFKAFVTLVLLGFPLALFFAWAYELTPEGVKKTREVLPSESLSRLTRRKLDFIIIGALVLGLGYFVVDKFVLAPKQHDEDLAAAMREAREAAEAEHASETPQARSIAVLAFQDMSPNKDQEHLSDGIAEELLNLLARIPELRVISRSSSFSYKGRDIRLSQVAEELGVANILEGSVRKAGDRVRITAQLIEAETDTHLWSETFDRTLDDIFAIQDEIARSVVDELRITLLGAVPQVPETDPEAYALLLQARHLRRQGWAESLEHAEALYEQALSINPDYADAWTELAITFANRVVFGLLPGDEGYGRARELAEKALAADPDHAGAHSLLSSIAMSHDNDLAAAARHMQRALAIDPADPGVLGSSAGLLWNLGRLDEAIALGEYLRSRDPVNPVIHNNLGWNYLNAGRPDKAIASGETVLRLSPGSRLADALIGRALLIKGEPAAALDAFARGPSGGYRIQGIALASHDLGQAEKFRAALAELIDGWGDEWPSWVAQVYAWTGDADRAFEWLDRAVAQGQSQIGWEFVYPLYQPLHDDPRWRAFRERVGRAPEQLAAIEFEVTLPEEGR